MLNSLLLSKRHPEKLVCFTVPGIHIEKYGSANQEWDAKVAEIVRAELAGSAKARECGPAWYALHIKWYVVPMSNPQDLDNLRLKPILDALTAQGLWPDDNVKYVRAIYSEAALVDHKRDQRVEVTIYGIDEAS